MLFRQKFHSLQISFYAEYKRDFLLEFLRGSNFYLLQDALKICTTRKLYPEMVFLLNKMGDLNGVQFCVISLSFVMTYYSYYYFRIDF